MARFYLLATLTFFFSALLTHAAAPITAAAFTPDGKHVLLGSQEGIAICMWPELKPTARITSECGHVHDLAFSPDGRHFAVAGGLPAESGTVEIYDWSNRKRTRKHQLGDDLIYKVAWSPDGTRWATAGADCTSRVVEAKSGVELVRYVGHSRSLLAVRFLPNGASVVTAGVDHTIQVWNAKSGELIRSMDNHVGPVTDLAVRPQAVADDAPVLASASEDRTVRLWQPASGRMIRFSRLPAVPKAVAWTPDGEWILVGCTNGGIHRLPGDTLKVTGEQLTLSGRLHELAVSADGQSILAAGEAGEVRQVRADDR